MHSLSSLKTQRMCIRLCALLVKDIKNSMFQISNSEWVVAAYRFSHNTH